MKSLKALLKSLLCIMLVSIIGTGLCSCGTRVTDEGAKNVVNGLVKKSYDLNRIYFGTGLKYTDSDEYKDSKYAPVSEEEKIQNSTDLREETNKVFSEEYSKSILTMALFGATSGDGETALFARYVEKDGLLTVYKNYKPLVLKDGQLVPSEKDFEINEYDLTKTVVTKNSRNFIEATITSLDGDTINITIVYEDNGWRIDSPTY